MPYHGGVWRPDSKGPITHGSTVVIKTGEKGKVEGTTNGETICVRIDHAIRVINKDDIVDVPPLWEN